MEAQVGDEHPHARAKHKLGGHKRAATGLQDLAQHEPAVTESKRDWGKSTCRIGGSKRLHAQPARIDAHLGGRGALHAAPRGTWGPTGCESGVPWVPMPVGSWHTALPAPRQRAAAGRRRLPSAGQRLGRRQAARAGSERRARVPGDAPRCAGGA